MSKHFSQDLNVRCSKCSVNSNATLSVASDETSFGLAGLEIHWSTGDTLKIHKGSDYPHYTN